MTRARRTLVIAALGVAAITAALVYRHHANRPPHDYGDIYKHCRTAAGYRLDRSNCDYAHASPAPSATP